MEKFESIINTKIKLRTIIVATIIIAIFIGTTAAVIAAIPDTNGKINSCYNNLTRTLRVTDPAGNCGIGSTAISWDQNGAANNIISNFLIFPYGEGIGQSVLNVPNLGIIRINACDSSEGARLEYLNNTANTVYEEGFAIAPNGTDNVADKMRLAAEINGVKYVASVDAVGNATDGETCSFTVQATLSQN